MMKTYALAKETETALFVLPFGPFTLAKAESLRDSMAQAGKTVHVVNLKTA
jgi:hypothetical protein